MSPARGPPLKPLPLKKGRQAREPNTASEAKAPMVATRSSQRVKEKREGDKSRSTSVAPSASQDQVDHTPSRKRKRNPTEEPVDGVSTRSKRTKSSNSKPDEPAAAKDDLTSSEDRELVKKSAKTRGASKAQSRGSSVISTSGYSTRSRGKLPTADSSSADSSFNAGHRSSASYDVVANGDGGTPSPAKSNSSSSAASPRSPETQTASDVLEVAINDPDLSASSSVNGDHQASASQEVVAGDGSPLPKKSNASSSITTPEIPAADLTSEVPDAGIDDAEGDASEGEPAVVSKRGRPAGFGRGRGRGRGGRGRGRGGRAAITPALSRQNSGTPAEKDPPKKRGYAGKRKTSENQLLQAAYDRQRDLRASFKSLAKLVRAGLTTLAEKDIERLQEDPEYHEKSSEHQIIIDGLQKRRTEVDAQRGREYDRKSAFLQAEWALKDDYTVQQFNQKMEDIQERSIVHFKAAVIEVIRLRQEQIDDDDASIIADETAHIRDMPDDTENEGSAEVAENDAQLDPTPRGRVRRVNTAKSSPKKRLANEIPANEPVAKRTNMLSAASAPADAPDDSDAAGPSFLVDQLIKTVDTETPDAQAAAIGKGDEYGVHIPGIHMPNRRRRGRAANEPNNRVAVHGWFKYEDTEIGIRSTEREAQGFPPNPRMWYLDQGGVNFSDLGSEDFDLKLIKTYKLHPRVGIPIADSCNPDDYAPPTDFTLPTPGTNPIVFKYQNGKRFPSQPLGCGPPRNADKFIHTSRSWFMIDTEEAWTREVEHGWGIKVATQLLSDTLGLGRPSGIATFDATARLRSDTVHAILDILDAASHVDENPSTPVKTVGQDFTRSEPQRRVSSVATTLPQIKQNIESRGMAYSGDVQRAQYDGAMGFDSLRRGLPGPLEALADAADSIRQKQATVTHVGIERTSTRRASPAPRANAFNSGVTQISLQAAAPPHLPRVGLSQQSPTLVTPQSSRRSGPPFSPQAIAPQTMPRQIMSQSILQSPTQPQTSHQLFRRAGSLSSASDLSRHSIMSVQPTFLYPNQSHTASQYYTGQQRVQQSQVSRGGRGQSTNGLRDLLPDLRPRPPESPQIPSEHQRYYDNAAQLPTYQHIQRAHAFQPQQQQPLLQQPPTLSPLQTQQSTQTHHSQPQAQTHHSPQQAQTHHQQQLQTHHQQQQVQTHHAQQQAQTHLQQQQGQAHHAQQQAQTHLQQQQAQTHHTQQQAQTHHTQQQPQTHHTQQQPQVHHAQQQAQTHHPPQHGQTHHPQQQAQTHHTQQPVQTHQTQQPGQIHRQQLSGQAHHSLQGQAHHAQQAGQAHHSQQSHTHNLQQGQTHHSQQPAQTHHLQQTGQTHHTQQPLQTHQPQQPGQIHRPQQPGQTHRPQQQGPTLHPMQPPQPDQAPQHAQPPATPQPRQPLLFPPRPRPPPLFRPYFSNPRPQ